MTKRTRNTIIISVISAILVLVITAVVVTLVLTLNKVQISYISDANIYHTENETKGEEIQLPADPIREGYNFGGWYHDYGIWEEKLSTDYLVKNYTPNDFNVYAKWVAEKKNTYTISYHINEEIVNTQHYYEGESINILDNESNVYGYDNGGWYYDYNVWELPFEEGKVINEDMDFYAKMINVMATEFDFLSSGDGYIISNYSGSDTSIIVPDKYNYKPIIGIEIDTFSDTIMSISLPDTIIGVTPFLANCTRLQELQLYCTIGDNVGVLFGASNVIDNIDCVPESLTKITYNGEDNNDNESYFDNIKSLTTVCFGNNYRNDEKISEYAYLFTFADCDKLSDFEVPATHERLITIDGVLYSADERVLLRHPNNKTFDINNISSRTSEFARYAFAFNMTIDEVIVTSITEIGDNCFNSSSISSISFLDEVNGPNIAESAFENCLSLKSISFSDSLAIGSNAFEGCVNLDRVNISSINDWCYMRFGIRYSNPLYYAKSLYLNGIHMDEIIIPNDVKWIGSRVFEGCDMSSIVLHDNIESIGDTAFKYCSNLTEVTLPSSLEIVDGWMFEGCINLEYVGLPSTIKIIGTAAFKGCSSLSTIDLPSNLEVLDWYAFSSSGIENIIIPDGVKVINAGAFIDCNNLTNVKLPQNLVSIDRRAFKGCTNLQDIQLSSNLNSIGESAFAGSGIKSIVIPDNVQIIEYSTFEGCTNLQEIQLSANLNSIGTSAFEGSGIKSIVIPDNVQIIEYSTFEGCTNLQEIQLSANLNSIGTSAFEGSGIKSIVIPDNVQMIEYSTFENCTSLTDVVFGSGLQIIENNAFEGCTSLSNLTLGEELQSVNFHAFEGCEQMNRVNIQSIESFCNIAYSDEESNPLYYARNLYLDNKLIKELIIPNGVVAINKYAFFNASLTSIVIPESVVDIGEKILSSSNVIIYAEPSSKPDGWLTNTYDGSWHGYNKVYWYRESKPTATFQDDGYSRGYWRYVNIVGVLTPVIW